MTSDERLAPRAEVTRIHAFGDGALGDLDAVGLVEAVHTGRRRYPRSLRPRSPAPRR